MRAIPLNAASDGRELSELCSNLTLGPSEHCQLTAQIDWIDRGFHFGNVRIPLPWMRVAGPSPNNPGVVPNLNIF